MEVKENNKKTLSKRRFKAGYIVKEEKVLTNFEDMPDGDYIILKSAYTFDGDYIGSPKDAYRLCKKRGIKPEKKRDSVNICSIGFCEKEQKWYGWSHRAIYGFGVGSTVKKGDCAYKPKDKEDFKENSINFWKDKHHLETYCVEDTNCGLLGIWVRWTYSNKVPNMDIRNKISGVFCSYPEEYGKGEWTAKTLEDAKQMAVDFSDGVS